MKAVPDLTIIEQVEPDTQIQDVRKELQEAQQKIKKLEEVVSMLGKFIIRPIKKAPAADINSDTRRILEEQLKQEEWAEWAGSATLVR